MATTKILADLDLNQNELQNVVLQNLASDPVSGSKEGRIWINTTTHKPMYYDGTNDQEFGSVYSEGNGIDITGNVISIDNTVTGATKCKITYDNNGLITEGADLSASDIPDISETYVATSLLGANSGVATLGSDGKVPSSQLPSFVDDVIDAYIVSGATALSAGWLSATSGGTALTPETDKIYVIVEPGEYQNKTYRWSGSTYVEISASPGSASESAPGIIEIATQVETNTGIDDTRAITPLKLATYTNGMVKKISANNGALTASSGVCTWTISNTLATADVQVQIFEVSTGTQVMAEVSVGSSTITIKMNSSSNISADTYRAVIIG